MLSRKNASRIMVIILVILVISTSFTTLLYLDCKSGYATLNKDYSLLKSQYSILKENFSLLKENFTSLKSYYDVLQSNYAILQNDYDYLKSAYGNLSVKYNRLQDNYTNLNIRYDRLKSDHEQLIIQYNALQLEFDGLATNYKKLELSYANLSAQYTIVQHELSIWKQLQIGTTLETYYDSVRANVLAIGGYPLGEERWWLFPEYYEISVKLAAEMAAHDAGNIYWPKLECESKYYEYTGEYSSQTARRILAEAIHFAGIKTSDDPVTKINKIMNFTNLLIHYEYRLVDHMWFPTETLAFRSGDCTSFSILEAALFEMVGIKSAIGFFKNSEGEGHAMILVRLDDLEGYQYYYYPDLTSLGLSKGKWIIIEPQYNSLYEQQLKQDNWIPQWKLIVAAEVPYGV
ncbi:MAG: hypothetical protein QXG36_02890 [Nitrososphaeria archaeon]